MIEGALALHALHDLSFRDALVVEAARVGGCAQLLSEDLQDGRPVGSVRIVDPFAT